MWLLRKRDLQQEEFNAEKLRGKEGNYLTTMAQLLVLCPSRLSSLSLTPTFPWSRNLGAEAGLFLGQGLGHAAARPVGLQHAGLLLGKGKEAVLNQKLLCLHGSSASLPGFASYFKVSALSG